MIVLIALLAVDLAVMAGWIYVNHHTLAALHARHAERVQQTLLGKNLAIQKDAKLCLHKVGDFEQRLDHMLIEVRQAVALMRDHDLEKLGAEVQAAIDKNMEFEIRCGKLMNDTERLTSDPRVQRAIKSG